MQTFDARHYRLVGHIYVDQAGLVGWYWCFQKLASNSGAFILSEEAKYVEADRVYFLKKDGSAEDRYRDAIPLPY